MKWLQYKCNELYFLKRFASKSEKHQFDVYCSVFGKWQLKALKLAKSRKNCLNKFFVSISTGRKLLCSCAEFYLQFKYLVEDENSRFYSESIKNIHSWMQLQKYVYSYLLKNNINTRLEFVEWIFGVTFWNYVMGTTLHGLQTRYVTKSNQKLPM